MTGVILETARLRLEPWGLQHLDALAAMGSDARVMRYLGGVQSREQTEVSIERVMRRWSMYGFGWWAFMSREGGELLGAGCIQHLATIEGNPLEIGWRLRADQWGRGLASEAARRMAAFAFDELASPILTAIAQPDNSASRRVMERLGMRYRGLESWLGGELATYEMTAAEWRARTTGQ